MVDKEYAQIFNRLSKEFSSRDGQTSITSMAILRKDQTGLPVHIWVDDGATHRYSGHGRRIKFQPNKGDHPQSRGFSAMTISDIPDVVGEHDLSGKDIQAIKAFVVRNKASLEALSDKKIGVDAFYEVMVPSGNKRGG